MFCYNYTPDVNFMTQFFKSYKLYTASGSAPPHSEKFWVCAWGEVLTFVYHVKVQKQTLIFCQVVNIYFMWVTEMLHSDLQILQVCRVSACFPCYVKWMEEQLSYSAQWYSTLFWVFLLFWWKVVLDSWADVRQPPCFQSYARFYQVCTVTSEMFLYQLV